MWGKSRISLSSSTSETFQGESQDVSHLGRHPGDRTDPDMAFRSLPSYAGRLPCNYCLFFRSPYGCLKGNDCSFCHHPSIEQGGAQPARPRKLRRDRCKSKVQQLLEMLTIEQGPDEVIHAIQAEAQRNKYSRTLCQSLLDDWFSHNGDARNRLAQSTAARLANAEPGLQDDGCRAMIRFSV